MTFVSKPRLELLIGGKVKLVEGHLVYEIRDGRSCVTIVAEEGTVSDLASVPRILRSAFPDRVVRTYSSIIHDRLYQGAMFDRRICDAIFYNAMKAEGIGLFYRWVMWAGVRLGGWVPYRKYRRMERK